MVGMNLPVATLRLQFPVKQWRGFRWALTEFSSAPHSCSPCLVIEVSTGFLACFIALRNRSQET